MNKYFIITYDNNSDIIETKEIVSDDLEILKEEAKEELNNEEVAMSILTNENKNIIERYLKDYDSDCEF